jgi:hypothetical protein
VGEREGAGDGHRQDGPDVEPVVAVVAHAIAPSVG